MGKVAIYTCIIGDYDELRQPRVVGCDVDYICFVGPGEKRADRVGVWEIRELAAGPASADAAGNSAGASCDSADVSCHAAGIPCSGGLLSRYPKMHPHVLLPGYEASLWIDGNIEICDGSIYGAIGEKMAAGVKYSGVPHPSRGNVYDEAVMCRNMGYIGYLRLARVFLFLMLHGEKRGGGRLMENNIIFRRHNDPDIVRMDELWWKKVNTLCRRDQISLMWCLRKCGIPLDCLFPEGLNSRNHPGLRYLPHGKAGK